ncbi:MAG: heme-binding protein [Steroidobacteraceae bacterium]
MKTQPSFILCSLLLLLGSSSLAQTPAAAPAGGATPPRTRPQPARGPALDIALEAAQTAMAACVTDNLKVAVVVADSAGGIKTALVGDDLSGQFVNFALRKIAVVKEFKQATSQVAARAREDQTLAERIAANKDWMAMPGAVPLMVSDELVGMIAVSGAKSEQDEACALAGAEAIKNKLK